MKWKNMKGYLALMLTWVLLLTGCSQPGANSAPASGAGNEAAKSGSKAPGTGGTAVGFIFVGTRDDYGYNQAAYLGSEAVQKAFPDLKVLRAENVPETAEAERVMEQGVHDVEGDDPDDHGCCPSSCAPTSCALASCARGGLRPPSPA